ncbi:MAG: hypothetical protein HGA85_05755, partial [Nanoarchaeota archaeon]|nr:hypothetical protein [Nanoarchaeota archaeon]
MFLSNHEVKHKWAPIGIFLVEAIANSLYFRGLHFTYLYAAAVFVFLRNIEPKLPKNVTEVFAELGKNSLIIYLIHTRFLYDILWIFKTLPTYVSYPLIFSLALGLSYLFAKSYTWISQYVSSKVLHLRTRLQKPL